MNKYIETDIKEIKEQLIWNHQHGYQTLFLLGSGISVSAGIPSAEGIIHMIREQFSSVCARTHPVTYEDHLSVLTPAQRSSVIRELAGNARINSAHLYLSSIVKAGYTNKLLTTNFDTLIQKSLALENIYPNVIDFPASTSPESLDLSSVSLFYMHGRKDGALSMQDEELQEQYADKMRKYFGDDFEKLTVIVVGYSGYDDPIFHFLSTVKSFENRLYWVGYGNQEPHDHIVRDILRFPRKQACFIKGYDADSFFKTLHQQLELPEPRILANPMDLVEEVMGNIGLNQAARLTIPDKPVEKNQVQEEIEVISSPENDDSEQITISEAKIVNEKLPETTSADTSVITRSEEEITELAKSTWENNIQSNYEELNNIIPKYGSEEAKKYFSYFLFNWGTELEKSGDQKKGAEADSYYRKAYTKYEEALLIKPDLKEAYNQWGVCLRNLAKSKEGEEADRLYEEAFQKFEEAILINPDEHEPYNNWALGLANLALTKNDVEAEKLYFQAFEKYQEAIYRKADPYEVYNNWGVCLRNFGLLKRESNSEKYFKESFQKFEAATLANPKNEMAFINWGTSIREYAKTRRPQEAVNLYQEAFEKYAHALEANPQSSDALNNWGMDFGNLARLKGIDEARKLFNDAFSKYKEALKFNPEDYVGLNNWAVDLWNYANLFSGKEAETAYKESFEKFDLALQMKPKSAELLTNKAICLANYSEIENQTQSEGLFNEALTCFFKATQVKPKLYEAYYQWGIAFRNHAEKPGATRIEELYIQSLKQFEKAMKNKPAKHMLYSQWDRNMINLADYLHEEEPEKMYQLIFKKYQDAIFTERSSLEFYNNYDINLTKMGDMTPEEEYEKLLAEALNEPVKS